ncbi:Uncharacterized mitochondrial protein AtMg00310 [Linum grandiflorum]
MALLAKQGWRLINNPRGCGRGSLKGIYFPNGSFLSTGKGRRPSWIWSSLCEARVALKPGVVRVVGDGSSSAIRDDPWVPSAPYGHPESVPPNLTLVYDVITAGREWDQPMLQSFCLVDELNAISRIPIGLEGADDFWAWRFNPSGKFTVKSAYHAARHLSEPIIQGLPPEQAWLWNLKVPPKVIFFLWRCAANAIATKGNLFIRKCHVAVMLGLCDQG